jgi:hypothetical protein
MDPEGPGTRAVDVTGLPQWYHVLGGASRAWWKPKQRNSVAEWLPVIARCAEAIAERDLLEDTAESIF